MEEKKYEFTDETMVITNTLGDETIIGETKEYTLHRIKALKDFGDVKKGDLGGFIEKESNLSQEENCWVYDDAKVYGKAEVGDDAKIKDSAEVYEDAVVFEDAWVSGEALVFGHTFVGGNAKIYDNAWVGGNAKVFGYAEICKYAEVRGNEFIYNTKITEKISKDKTSFLEKFLKKKQERKNGRKNKGIELD